MQKTPTWLSVVARIGFAAKGTIYLVLGLLALTFAIGYTAEVEDMRGTIEKISQQTFGTVVLLVLAIGLANYAVWNTAQCGWDPERVGIDWIGRALRVFFGLGAGLNFFLAYKIASVAVGGGWGGASGDEAVKTWTQRVLAWPAGRFLVLLAALIVAAVAISLIVRLVRGKFMDVFSDRKSERAANHVVQGCAWLGFGARAIVAAMVAWFLWRAGITAQPQEAGGFTKALATLLHQPYGRWLVGGTAVGLMAQGLYICLMVPYREIRVKEKPSNWSDRWRQTFGS